MSDEDTRIALETHLAECQLRYKIFEEKLDNVTNNRKRSTAIHLNYVR